MTTPSTCDGSCLKNGISGGEITCEDGEILMFISCMHDDTWFLITVAPAIAIEED